MRFPRVRTARLSTRGKMRTAVSAHRCAFPTLRMYFRPPPHLAPRHLRLHLVAFRLPAYTILILMMVQGRPECAISLHPVAGVPSVCRIPFLLQERTRLFCRTHRNCPQNICGPDRNLAIVTVAVSGPQPLPVFPTQPPHP